MVFSPEKQKLKSSSQLLQTVALASILFKVKVVFGHNSKALLQLLYDSCPSKKEVVNVKIKKSILFFIKLKYCDLCSFVKTYPILRLSVLCLSDAIILFI